MKPSYSETCNASFQVTNLRFRTMKPPNTERSIAEMVPMVVARTKSRNTAAIARNIVIHERCKAKKIKN